MVWLRHRQPSATAGGSLASRVGEMRDKVVYSSWLQNSHNCAHMHCDVDLRSRRMWAASYRLTRLIMNEDSHVLGVLTPAASVS